MRITSLRDLMEPSLLFYLLSEALRRPSIRTVRREEEQISKKRMRGLESKSVSVQKEKRHMNCFSVCERRMESRT